MRVLTRAWEVWKRVARFVGDWLARVVLTGFYFTVFAPFALLTRAKVDPLEIQGRRPPAWVERSASDATLAGAHKLS